jgi:hypothetical protein
MEQQKSFSFTARIHYKQHDIPEMNQMPPSNRESRAFLVSCVAVKQPYTTRAADLYVSPWFLKVRELVETTGDPWFILSAEHGLIAPDAIVAPYNRTLNTMPVADRQAWGARVRRQMSVSLPKVEEIVVLAGMRYRENIMAWLTSEYTKVTVPMAGLPIGKQLSWLSNVKAL